MKTLMSWNVNGVRAAFKKGMGDWLTETQPDVLCLQETKIQEEQLTDILRLPAGYTSYWASAEKKGYSGVAVYVKTGEEPSSVSTLGKPEFDGEGRTLVLEYDNFVLINGYFPNSRAAGGEENSRLEYKLSYCAEVQDFAEKLIEEGKNVLICGDYNVAHKPIDLARPKQNEKNPGYLPEERAWMDEFQARGFVDTFRIFDQGPDNYSWWTYRMGARARNVGWRIDYFWASAGFAGNIKNASIHPDVMGSDHCPVSVELE
jgi:exodeoxyribonuclease III